MASELVLVVDDEPSIIQLATIYLEREGFRVQGVGDGEAALETVASQHPALIVLDVMLPKMDGLEVCRQLRAKDDPVAILILTARDEDIDKILGLELGADDYMTKPFNPRELVARVKAILRRDRKPPKDEKPVVLGELTIDPVRREVRLADQILDLRTQEFDLLLTLADQLGRVFTREQLLHKAWGLDSYGQPRPADEQIAHLRRNLDTGSVNIATVT